MCLPANCFVEKLPIVIFQFGGLNVWVRVNIWVSISVRIMVRFSMSLESDYGQGYFVVRGKVMVRLWLKLDM